MIHYTSLDQLEQDPLLLTRESMTPVNRVETTQGDDGLLEELVIQGYPFQPGIPEHLRCNLGGLYNLLKLQKLTKKATKYEYLLYSRVGKTPGHSGLRVS
jgi:hypothetical protein